MDFFDLLPIVPGPGPGRDLSPRETLAAAISFALLPVLDLGLVMLADLAKHPKLVLLWLPALMAALAALTCRLLRVGLGQAILDVVGCVWWCFLGGAILVAIDVFLFAF